MTQDNLISKVRRVRRKNKKSCKFDSEGTRGPIGPEVVVLESWQLGDHASTKNYVDLMSSVFDLFSAQYLVHFLGSRLPTLDIDIDKKCFVLCHTSKPEPSTGGKRCNSDSATATA